MAKEKLTAGRIRDFRCPPGKSQGFLWDAEQRGLGLRVTAAGARSFIFEGLHLGRSVRITIGSPDVWTIPGAQKRVRELQQLIDQGIDPRSQKADREAAEDKRRADEQRNSLTIGDIWPIYMAEGKPRGKAAWKPRYRADLEKAADPGGKPKKRGAGLTKPGHLAPLMPMRLADIDVDAVRDWYSSEQRRAPVQAARAVAMFSGFLGWCRTQKEYRELVNTEAARSTELRDLLPAKRRREDALAIAHLAPWFAGTDRLQSAVARAYLQALVLTGARREEMAALRWADIDFRWKTMVLADKVGDTRRIPLSPYLEQQLHALPRARLPNGKPNPYVFSSSLSASGRIAEPRSPHDTLLEAAGIPHVSIHGLRRTFALLGEAAGAPAGAIAQVQGHRPSATAEGYKPRTIDALRPYLEQIEAFILARAGVDFVPAEPAGNVVKLAQRVA